MEIGWSGQNNEEHFHGIFEGVKKIECYFILWIYENYTQQIKHDGMCVYLFLLLVQPPCPDDMLILERWCYTPCKEEKEILDSVP